MQTLLKKILLKIIKSQSFFRRILLLILDNILFQLSFAITFSILENNFISASYFNYMHHFFLYSLIASIVFTITGQYKSLTKYLNTNNLYKIIIRNFAIIVIIYFFNNLTKITFIKFNNLILVWIFSSLSIASIKFLIKDILTSRFLNQNNLLINVVIFGAGSAGAQLAASLKIEGKHKIHSFIDENPELWKRFLNGIPISSVSKLDKIKENIDQILVAVPSSTNKNKKRILNYLKSYDIPILEVPSIEDLTSGKAKIDSLKPISIEALLGRDKVLPIKSLFGPGIKGKNICVTGAGGSIGSELSKQIIKLEPKSIYLLDNSEPSLYRIYEDLKLKNYNKITIKAYLTNASNKAKIKEIFNEKFINIVFHAAAFKHVPLVEENPLEGLHNNIFSTLSICEAAKSSKVEKVILISSDKAVRPTNIMGVSKRISELIIQAFAEDENNSLKTEKKLNCLFSMVRFGNVLDSSGSVIPLFKKQISEGGPLTVTHKEMTRYFMTIPEAAQLVIQAAVLSKGGDVFLLDMGEPIKIYELAKQIIFLSGLSYKNENNQNGDIEIKFTGIRPGEKLYEELLINAESSSTSHPLIFKAKEKKIKREILVNKLNLLKEYIFAGEKLKCFDLVKSLVPEWSYFELNKLK